MKVKPFVPLEKSSKKAQREAFKKQRGNWGAINPVTRKSPDPRAYKRKRIRKGDVDEQPVADFFVSHDKL